MRRLTLFCIPLVLAWSEMLPAQAARDSSAAGQRPTPLCYRARPKPACSAFILTNFGGYAVTGDFPVGVVVDWGWMANVSTRSAIGTAVDRPIPAPPKSSGGGAHRSEWSSAGCLGSRSLLRAESHSWRSRRSSDLSDDNGLIHRRNLLARPGIRSQIETRGPMALRSLSRSPLFALTPSFRRHPNRVRSPAIRLNGVCHDIARQALEYVASNRRVGHCRGDVRG